MAEPPKTPPHSDLGGVNRDARIQVPSKEPHPDPGEQIDDAKSDSTARPHETKPL